MSCTGDLKIFLTTLSRGNGYFIQTRLCYFGAGMVTCAPGISTVFTAGAVN